MKTSAAFVVRRHIKVSLFDLATGHIKTKLYNGTILRGEIIVKWTDVKIQYIYWYTFKPAMKFYHT